MEFVAALCGWRKESSALGNGSINNSSSKLPHTPGAAARFLKRLLVSFYLKKKKNIGVLVVCECVRVTVRRAGW